MKFKLDENFDLRLAAVLAEGGHDVDTVRDEQLSGSDDETIYQTCRTEDRVLITLDLDFSNPLRFPPGPTEGIVVVRPPRPTLPMVRATLKSALAQIKSGNLKGALWIVEPGRVRAYDPHRGPSGPQ